MLNWLHVAQQLLKIAIEKSSHIMHFITTGNIDRLGLGLELELGLFLSKASENAHESKASENGQESKAYQNAQQSIVHLQSTKLFLPHCFFVLLRVRRDMIDSDLRSHIIYQCHDYIKITLYITHHNGITHSYHSSQITHHSSHIVYNISYITYRIGI